MKIIAHRGLLDGPNPELENRPDTIQKALDDGFEVEIDLHIKDGNLWLGHDGPTYPITHSFINHENRSRLWVHAKTLETASYCCDMLGSYTNWFFHQNDDCTIISNWIVWTYPRASIPLFHNSVAVLPELVYTDSQIREFDCYGICTDYANKFKDMK